MRQETVMEPVRDTMTAGRTNRRVLGTPLKGDRQGRALYLATHDNSAQKSTVSSSIRSRSKPPSTAPARETPLPFDPEADFTFESRLPTPEAVQDDTRAGELRDSYKKLCRLLHVTPCSNISRQFGSTALNLSELKLSSKEFKAVLTTLVNDTELIQVDLTGNPATSKEAGYVGELLKSNKYITHLVLSEMNLTGSAMETLANIIKTCMGIVRLDISSNFLCDKDCQAICNIIEDTDGIRELILHHNQLGECGVLLGRVIADNVTVTYLDLSWNHIRGQGAIGIARGLQRNQHLQHINLGWNGFGFDGCAALAHCLIHNTTLQVLDLTSNRIHLPALHKLLDGLVRNKTLSTLMLGTNPIPAHCTTYILERLKKWKHGNLKELDLEGVVVDREFESTLKEIQQNRILLVRYETALPLSKNQVSKVDPNNIFNIDPVRILFFMKQHMRTIDLFLKIDKDTSGTLTKDEMKYAFELEGFPISDAALDQVMAYLDTNNDGDVDLKEFFDAERRVRRERIKEAQESISKQPSPLELKGVAKMAKYSQAFVQPPANKTPGMSPRSNTFL